MVRCRSRHQVRPLSLPLQFLPQELRSAVTPFYLKTLLRLQPSIAQRHRTCLLQLNYSPCSIAPQPSPQLLNPTRRAPRRRNRSPWISLTSESIQTDGYTHPSLTLNPIQFGRKTPLRRTQKSVQHHDSHPSQSTNARTPQLTSLSSEGRLQQATLDLLAGCDVQFRRETRLDIALVKNLPIALIFLPAADIPTFVGEGRVDLGITGRDQVAEHDATLPNGEQSGVEEILDLGFGGCKLQVQVPQKGDIDEAKQLIGRNVVTSFTALSEAFFAKLEGAEPGQKLRTKIKYVGGSVEAACALGVADGIVDLVGTFLHPTPSSPVHRRG